MNEENINKTNIPLRVLISPLDWGLGHATRCIPVIHVLLKHDVSVFIAADGATKKILQKEFQNVTFLSLSGYNIRYSAKKSSFLGKMLAQVPRIFRAIKNEKKWLATAIEEHQIDAVISDNRFGFYNKKVKSIYITHQLHIETGNGFLNTLAQKIHYSFINRFDECWVPDNAGEQNLAGKLSHPKKVPAVPVKYLGPLSRFEQKYVTKSTHILFLISGPEPQRTIFEEKLLQQIDRLLHTKKLSVTMVRGLPETDTFPAGHSNISFFNHLPAGELSAHIAASELVVVRSGYSSVMDLVKLRQKAVLVPTPGQTEQEYLADHLWEKRMFFTQTQDGLSVVKMWEEAANFTPVFPENEQSFLENVVVQFLKAATTKK